MVFFYRVHLGGDIDKFLKLSIESEKEFFDLKGHRIEQNIFPSYIIKNYTRLEILLGLKFSGHADTLTEASNLIDDLYERCVKRSENQYRKGLYNFQTK